MGVIFDEVEGSVEPQSEPAASESQGAQPRKEASLNQVRQVLWRLKQREARLSAD